MNALFIEGKRTMYVIDKYCTTLTVGELIRVLSGYDEDTPVYLRNDNGYTYGEITERDINTAEELGIEVEDQ